MASDAQEFTQLVRTLRRRRRRQRSRKLAYAVYVALLVMAIYGGPAIVRAAQSLSAARSPDLTTFRIDAATPYALTGLALLILIGQCRQALWGGPVAMSEADAAWLLPLPVSRRRVLLPRYLASGALLVMVASVLAAIGSVALHEYAVGPIRRLLPAAIEYATSLALVGLGLAALTERSVRVAVYVRWAQWPAILTASLLAVLACLAATAQVSRSAPSLAESFDLRYRSALGVLAVASASYGALVVPNIPAIGLRNRAEIGTSLATAFYVADLRRARLAMQSAARGSGRGARLRLRPPRWASLSIPWRDLNSVLAAPAGLGWAAAWIALGAAGLVAAARRPADDLGELFATVLAMLCCYIAALPYTESTRLDADDIRRIRWSPYPIRSLTNRHAIMPAILATVGQLIAASLASIWLDGAHEVLALCVAAATGPVVAVAAMISAFRGPMPLGLIFGSLDIGFGSVGPALLVMWYLLGPVAAIALGGLAALPALHAFHAGSSIGIAGAESLLVGSVSTAVLVGWARQRASQRYSD